MVSYMFTVVGMPVYLHYCGGELEKVNYFVKGGSCCDGEESDETANGCCKDEGLYVQNGNTFTLKTFNYQLLKISIAFLPLLPQAPVLTAPQTAVWQVKAVWPPPLRLQQQLSLDASVLRI